MHPPPEELIAGIRRRVAEGEAPASRTHRTPASLLAASAAGFRYASRAPAPGAPSRSQLRLLLRAGGDGQARIILRGTGVALELAPLPALQPLTVQLRSSEDVCWEATYGPPARQSSASRFTDRAD